MITYRAPPAGTLTGDEYISGATSRYTYWWWLHIGCNQQVHLLVMITYRAQPAGTLTGDDYISGATSRYTYWWWLHIGRNQQVHLLVMITYRVPPAGTLTGDDYISGATSRYTYWWWLHIRRHQQVHLLVMITYRAQPAGTLTGDDYISGATSRYTYWWWLHIGRHQQVHLLVMITYRVQPAGTLTGDDYISGATSRYTYWWWLHIGRHQQVHLLVMITYRVQPAGTLTGDDYKHRIYIFAYHYSRMLEPRTGFKQSNHCIIVIFILIYKQNAKSFLPSHQRSNCFYPIFSVRSDTCEAQVTCWWLCMEVWIVQLMHNKQIPHSWYMSFAMSTEVFPVRWTIWFRRCRPTMMRVGWILTMTGSSFLSLLEGMTSADTAWIRWVYIVLVYLVFWHKRIVNYFYILNTPALHNARLYSAKNPNKTQQIGCPCYAPSWESNHVTCLIFKPS